MKIRKKIQTAFQPPARFRSRKMSPTIANSANGQEVAHRSL